MNNQPHITPDLEVLVGLFYSDPAQFGQPTSITTTDMPLVYQRLLAHQDHMTVTVEHFYGCSVDVQVLATVRTNDHYARKILLRRQTDNAVVQFGIVRLDFRVVSPVVRAAVESQATPLGRILIEHNVLREVHLARLWCIAAGTDLADLFGVPTGATVYGRTAIIDCNGEPAVELLEIVTPVANQAG